MEEVRPDKRAAAHHTTTPSIFLAGSIEQGKAEDWQSKTVQEFKDYNIRVYNPRRENWDPNLDQTLRTKAFREQVLWEQQYLLTSNYVLFNFIGDTKSPISLLELGQVSRGSGQEIIVACPKEFWRRGNIEVVCALFKLPLYESLDDAIAYIKTHLSYGSI